MAYENIRFSKPNMSMVDGYFWMLDDTLDVLVAKTDDGTQAFTYPLDNSVSTNVTSMEYDGYNLWTLETVDSTSIRIRRWYLNNYVCKLAHTFNLVESGSHKFNSNAMAVEQYEVAFSSTEVAGSNNLSIQDNAGGAICSKMQTGYTVILGPNSSGRTEEFSVISSGSDYVIIGGNTSYEYHAGDKVRFFVNIYLFNNYNGIDDSTGALYKISPYTGSVITKYSGHEYKNVNSAMFYGVPYFVFNGGFSTEPRYYAVCYVKSTNMIFLDIDEITNALGSMTMDNIQDDLSTIIDIYDLGMYGNNIYRLQREATYYGDTASFANGTYNYQLSTFNPIITSISIAAEPAILPADGASQSNITAIVKDQFGLPCADGKLVTFTDDDPDGVILVSPVATVNGVANTVYRAGIEAREVRISAIVSQG